MGEDEGVSCIMYQACLAGRQVSRFWAEMKGGRKKELQKILHLIASYDSIEEFVSFDYIFLTSINSLEMSEKINTIITPEELAAHWSGHRGLTRKLIEAFPEKEFFEFSIGDMRPAAQLIQEMMDVSTGGVREMAGGVAGHVAGHAVKSTSKAEALEIWDKNTAELFENLSKIPVDKFHDKILSFGQYEGTIWGNIFYFLDNEIHHRGQAYVYLRAIGVEPPAFWDRLLNS